MELRIEKHMKWYKGDGMYGDGDDVWRPKGKTIVQLFKFIKVRCIKGIGKESVPRTLL